MKVPAQLPQSPRESSCHLCGLCWHSSTHHLPRSFSTLSSHPQHNTRLRGGVARLAAVKLSGEARDKGVIHQLVASRGNSRAREGQGCPGSLSITGARASTHLGVLHPHPSTTEGRVEKAHHEKEAAWVFRFHDLPISCCLILEMKSSHPESFTLTPNTMPPLQNLAGFTEHLYYFC